MQKDTNKNKASQATRKDERIDTPRVSIFLENITEAWDFIWDIGKTLLFVVALAFVIRFYLVQPFYIEGQSMEPNFIDGEYLLIDELSYHFRDPIRGEVIVFKPHINTYQNYIKRIIALPGEKVVFDAGVTVIKDTLSEGKLLEEPYIDHGIAQGTNGDDSTILLENEYYVLGDNRFQSSDSRVFGPISSKNIVGRAWLTIKTAPWRHIRLLGRDVTIPKIVSISRVHPPAYAIDTPAK